MRQLEKRFYTRSELAEVLQIRLDNKNFARDVKNTLMNWGYSFEYSRKGAEITRQPQTDEEKLAEIMIRKYDIDIQVDTYAFACFIIAFFEIETFDAMPWEERAKNLIEIYGIETDGTVESFARTLKKWCSKLMKSGTIIKSNAKMHWRTTCFNGKKFREWINGDAKLEEEMHRYFESRKKYLEEYITAEIAKGRKDYKEINTEAWKHTNEELWRKYGCCYYSCKTLVLSAFDDMEELAEVYELVKGISADCGNITKVDIIITSGIAKPDKNGFTF